jgi:hypothetical protein
MSSSQHLIRTLGMWPRNSGERQVRVPRGTNTGRSKQYFYCPACYFTACPGCKQRLKYVPHLRSLDGWMLSRFTATMLTATPYLPYDEEEGIPTVGYLFLPNDDRPREL